MSRKEKSTKSFGEAILLIVFNRPDLTQQVLARIREVRPSRLYIASDGPRFGNKRDRLLVNKTRLLLSMVDWRCDLQTRLSEENQGCKLGVSNALSWFFSREERGIILEDDCLPSVSFFEYCSSQLQRFHNDSNVALISGDGRLIEKVGPNGYQCRIPYPFIWGWASWARVWRNYDAEMRDWPSLRRIILKRIPLQAKYYWHTALSQTYSGRIDTWDYQFAFMMLRNDLVCILPPRNLITNLGLGHSDATHTSGNYPSHKHESFEIPGNAPYQVSEDLSKKVLDMAHRDYYGVEFTISRLLIWVSRVCLRQYSRLIKAIF